MFQQADVYGNVKIIYFYLYTCMETSEFECKINRLLLDKHSLQQAVDSWISAEGRFSLAVARLPSSGETLQIQKERGKKIHGSTVYTSSVSESWPSGSTVLYVLGASLPAHAWLRQSGIIRPLMWYDGIPRITVSPDQNSLTKQLAKLFHNKLCQIKTVCCPYNIYSTLVWQSVKNLLNKRYILQIKWVLW